MATLRKVGFALVERIAALVSRHLRAQSLAMAA